MADIIKGYKVPAPARVGSIAPVDVIVPAGGTGMDPSQTSFFQILNIPTKINKGTVEIVSDVFLVKKGDKARAPAHSAQRQHCPHCPARVRSCSASAPAGSPRRVRSATRCSDALQPGAQSSCEKRPRVAAGGLF